MQIGTDGIGVTEQGTQVVEMGLSRRALGQ
jgi:hypothetical protein